MAGSIQHASLTDVGIRRSHNQDSHIVLPATDPDQWQARGHLFVVADGMGAHAVGELASKLAVDIIPHIYAKHVQEGAAAALRKAFVEANLSIHDRGQQNREFEGMGTTGTALVVRPEGVWIGHVGDSRAYRIRAGQIEQLSFDHSLHWELARRQRINPDKLQGIPSNVIVRSLGPEPLVQVDVEGPHPVVAGDVFVLCSDGLSGPVSDHEIGAVASVLPPEEACRFLVHLANLRGGPDNITVVIVQATEGNVAADAAAVAPPAPPAWWQRVPWFLAALCLGVLLAVGAAALSFEQKGVGALVFLLASGLLAAGTVGLIQHYRHERRRQEHEPETPRINVYSKVPCGVQKGLVDKLAKAVATLEQRARDKQWDVDWTAFHRLQSQAETYARQGQLPDTFRESCRALDLLIESFLGQRNKEEIFQPVWDKSPG